MTTVSLPINAAAHIAGSVGEEPSPAASAEPDIPTLNFSSSSNTPTASQIDEDDHYYRQEVDVRMDGSFEIEMHEYRDSKNNTDLEDDDDDDDQEDEDENPEHQPHADEDGDGDEHIDDIEASFLRSTKPVCSKTTLVSCLSSRSTSPGPLSPLLSDEDFSTTRSISSALSECDNESGPPSATLSRRSSAGTPSEASSHRVRFKKGCVITEVNLTWASASYDRAPIDVAESLDIKRCHSLDDDGECDSGSDNDYDDEDGYERDDPDFGEVEIDACGQWVQGLHCNDAHEQPSDTDDEVDERFFYYSDTTAASPIPIARPPSPPLPSSPCTSMQVSIAYHNAFGGSTPTQTSVMRQRCEQEEAEAANRASPPSSVASSAEMALPPLVQDDSSCSDSSNEEAQATNTVHHMPLPSRVAPSAVDDSSPSTPSTIKDCYFFDPRSDATPTVVTASSSTTRPRRDESPSTIGDQPIRKVPRYAACLDRFRRSEDLYSNCEALGGF